jgi:hypothetical protein
VGGTRRWLIQGCVDLNITALERLFGGASGTSHPIVVGASHIVVEKWFCSAPAHTCMYVEPQASFVWV